MNCNITNKNKELRFENDALALIAGATVIGGISFSSFIQDVNSYSHVEQVLEPHEEIIIINPTNTYRTIAIKASYEQDKEVFPDEMIVYYKTNYYDDQDLQIADDDVWNSFSSLLVFDTCIGKPVSSFTVKNVTNYKIYLNYLLTK